ncbi:MAG TPA: collagenase-like protease, partial [Porphyromonadaceae bacterium]|nr:collagenase-like protease [Porphyromonadaceae bacterium]
TVVECYKEAVLAYCDGSFSEERIANWDERLSTVFNRGFWDGYYLGQRLGEWTSNYGSGATKKKVYIGKGMKYFANVGVAEFLLETQTLNVGDEVLITGPTTGAITQIVEELRVDFKPVQQAVKGDLFSIKTNEKIRPSDKIFKLVPNDPSIQ